jgi:uncharacterized protein
MDAGRGQVSHGRGRSTRLVRDDATEGRSEQKLDRADVILSKGTGPTFGDILQRRISRRGLMKTGAAAAGALALTGPVLKPGTLRIVQPVKAASALGSEPAHVIAFQPIAPQPVDAQQITVAADHAWAPLLKWGDPIHPDAPAFDYEHLAAADQLRQVGYNCDYVGFIPMGNPGDEPKRGLLWVNHEYTDAHIMWPDWEEGNPTRAQAEYEMAAHGGTVVEIVRDDEGRMRVELGSRYNRRIHVGTPMRVSGPAAGHDWLKTAADPYGSLVLGTLNNCAGGITPWGTVLTGEENFQSYFGGLSWFDADDERWAVHERYGIEPEETSYGWGQHDARFLVSSEPNEPFRFGWIVEIDPWDPDSTPVKRTALGRFRHEGATFGHSPSGRVVFYTGDDERYEYAYKYVSTNAYDPLKRGIGQGLLDEGTLYVARFDDDGSGEWLPLVHGEGPLTAENGFHNQGDILIKTRLASDLLGATRMDRPEDFEQNPWTHKVYLALTNNTRRMDDETDTANPRAENAFGHVIEITEADNDAASLTFAWDIFLLCGDPEDESTYFAGFPKELVSPIANPDNIAFGPDGNLWLSTDGQPGSLELADALHVVPTLGEQRGMVSQFLAVVAGAECSGPEFTDDYRNLFVAVQHPGEGGSFAEPETLWPDGHGIPRPTVIQVWNTRGQQVGGQ